MKDQIELPPLPRSSSGNGTLVIGYGPDDEVLRAWGQSAVQADRQRRGEPDACGFVHVKNSAVDWLKTHFPALCVKSGLCGKVGGRLYTLTRFSFSDPQPAESVNVPSDMQPLLDMIDMLCTGLEWNIENHPEVMNEADSEALEEARALLARYGGNQPAANAVNRVVGAEENQ